MQDRLAIMRRRVLRHADGFLVETAIPRVGVGVARQPSTPVLAQYQPMACVVLQGAKQVMIGDRVLRYDPACSFVASLELPATAQIVEAAPETPYVAVGLTLDHALLADVIGRLPAAPERPTPSFAVTPMTDDLLHAWDGLLALLDAPGDVAVLAPLREQELLYRLLRSPHGDRLRQIARSDSRLAQVRRAVQWIQAHFREPMRIETLAEIAGMSVPSLHRNFKEATAMSPLQFQKVLRLQAARRMLATSSEASRAAFAVGYESVSQFSREYARLFGLPPSRDAASLRRGGASRLPHGESPASGFGATL